MKKMLLMAIVAACSLSGAYARKVQPSDAVTPRTDVPTCVLYNEVLDGNHQPADVLFEEGVNAVYHDEGLCVEAGQGRVRLDRYYSLGRRSVRYVATFSEDAVAQFYTVPSVVPFCVDMHAHRIIVGCQPEAWKKIEWLVPDEQYLVEIDHEYGTNISRITRLTTGESEEIVLTTDGPGGSYAGMLNTPFNAGPMWDYYAFDVQQGTMTVSRMSVIAGACDLTLLIYGDSITDPEDYYPASQLPGSWTQLVMGHVQGRALSSGRSGTNVPEILLRIRNELPYVKAKYVMITIGTNGGNTAENLSELIEYIIAQGSIPILNNIPCNESGTQTSVNELLESMRQKYGLNGCRFDLATSLAGDGLEVDKSMMFFENLMDVFGKDIFHHPNTKGARQMFVRTLIDVPEIYDGI